MPQLNLTFAAPSEDATMIVDSGTLHSTNSGEKLGSDLVVGDGLTMFGSLGTLVIASITPEA